MDERDGGQKKSSWRNAFIADQQYQPLRLYTAVQRSTFDIFRCPAVDTIHAVQGSPQTDHADHLVFDLSLTLSASHKFPYHDYVCTFGRSVTFSIRYVCVRLQRER